MTLTRKRVMKKMKLTNIRNIEGLFKVIDQCTGKIELVGDDIRINLKSKLSQYFSLAQLFSGGEIPELELIAYNQEDVIKLIEFLAGDAR